MSTGPRKSDRRRPLLGKRVYDEQGRQICGAKARHGGICRARPLANGRCKHHGGMSVSGPGHPNYIDGRHSRFLPAGIREGYEKQRDDSKLVELRDEIALTDTLLGQVFAHADLGNTRKTMAQLRGLVEQIKQHSAKRNGAGIVATIEEIDTVVSTQHGQLEALFEIAVLVDLRRKLVTAEANRIHKMHQVLTTEQALILLDQVVRVISENVRDRKQLAGITSGIKSIVDANPAPPIERAR